MPRYIRAYIHRYTILIPTHTSTRATPMGLFGQAAACQLFDLEDRIDRAVGIRLERIGSSESILLNHLLSHEELRPTVHEPCRSRRLSFHGIGQIQQVRRHGVSNDPELDMELEKTEGGGMRTCTKAEVQCSYATVSYAMQKAAEERRARSRHSDLEWRQVT